jgi:hypothetical protein
MFEKKIIDLIITNDYMHSQSNDHIDHVIWIFQKAHGQISMTIPTIETLGGQMVKYYDL